METGVFLLDNCHWDRSLKTIEEECHLPSKGGIAVASCPSTDQLLDAEKFLAESLLEEQILDAEHLSHRRLAPTVVTNLESLLLRLAEKSSHVYITERVLYTKVQRKGSVAYHRDPAAIGFDLPHRQTVTGCRHTQLTPLAHIT